MQRGRMNHHATHPRPEYGRSLVMDAPIPGTILAERYRVERVLGHGGMGIVVAARHLHLDERVAIKLLLPELSHESVFVERFVREARAAVKIRSEHVGRVFDVGRLDDGSPYIVMEYLDGCDLAALVCAEGPLARARAIDFVLQACEALSEAHVLGIVHRDLKPENLFLTRRADGSSCVKVLDFGISKQTGAQRSGAKTAFLLGSPMYMSPEQLNQCADIDARADIWSLGVVLFELLTASQPFVGESLGQLVTNILHKEAPLVRSCRPDLPEGLERVVHGCLRKDREQRFRDIGSFARELAQFGATGAWASADRASRVSASAPPSFDGASERAYERADSSSPRPVWSWPAPSEPIVDDGARSLPPGLPSPRKSLFGAALAACAALAALGAWRIARPARAPESLPKVAAPQSPAMRLAMEVPPPAPASEAMSVSLPASVSVSVPTSPSPRPLRMDAPPHLAPSASTYVPPPIPDDR